MTPEELRDARDAAGDEDALRHVIQSCSAHLRGPNDDDRIGLVAEIAPLVWHVSEKVRRAMADACDAFPGEMFEEAYQVLAGDRDGVVCAAARRAGERRAEQRRAASRSDDEDPMAAEIAAEIEARHGKAAHALAKRLAKREVEQYLERVNHETTRLDDAIDRALESMEAELAGPDVTLAILRTRVDALRERLALQRSLLKRARDYTRHVRPVFAPENVASIVGEAHAQLVGRLGERAERLDFVADVPRMLSMDADRDAVLQALQNVLENAVEAYATDAESLPVRVVARALRKTTSIELAIEDGGAGMSEEAKKQLFVPFRSSKQGGTGVGLLIARKMVEEVHGGTFEVDSTLGEGTTVVLTLPARQAGVRERE